MKRSPMPPRSAPMARGKGLARTGRVNPVNTERKAKAFARNFGDEADAVRAMPCLCRGHGAFVRCSGDVVDAHVVSRGAGGGRFDVVPLCDGHHTEQHKGIKTFAARYGLDLRAIADRIALEHECSRPAEPGDLGLRPVARAWANLHGMPEGYDRDALFGWVRRCVPPCRPDDVTPVQAYLEAVSDGLHLHVADGCALIDAVGSWPS